MQRRAQAKTITNVVKQQPHRARSLPDTESRQVSRKPGRRHDGGTVLTPGSGSLQTRSGSSSVETNRLGNRAMSEKNPIRIYVTHSFASHSDYHRVFEYLEA